MGITREQYQALYVNNYFKTLNMKKLGLKFSQFHIYSDDELYNAFYLTYNEKRINVHSEAVVGPNNKKQLLVSLITNDENDCVTIEEPIKPKMDTIAKYRLIGNYMGRPGKTRNLLYTFKGLYNLTGDTWIHLMDMKFNTSWDWIMLVVKKIADERDESLGVTLHIICSAYLRENTYFVNLDDVFESVVYYIQNKL